MLLDEKAAFSSHLAGHVWVEWNYICITAKAGGCLDSIDKSAMCTTAAFKSRRYT